MNLPSARRRSGNVGVVDLIGKSTRPTIYSRFTNPNNASIMPQAIAVWLTQLGHEVTYVPFTGVEDITEELPSDIKVLFIASYTAGAYLAYALSNLYRSRGAVTVLGGPHAEAYARDAALYFDYVMGHAGKASIERIVEDPVPHPEQGVWLADNRPSMLPGLKERWPFVQKALAKTPMAGLVGMISSLGCPYTCDFCRDADSDFKMLPADQLVEDLTFLQQQPRPPTVIWHDPNFAIRFNESLDLIESCVPPGALSFLSQTSLTLLTEPNLKRLRHNNFVAQAPGIESWFDYGSKSGVGRSTGLAKVDQTAEQVNMICRYIPYVVCNLVFGLDVDEGPLPFELSQRFLDAVPSVYPGIFILTAYGQLSPLSRQLQDEGRVLDVPFYFLDNFNAANVRIKHYEHAEFYGHLIKLSDAATSPSRIWGQFHANKHPGARFLMAFRSIFGQRRGFRMRRAVRDGLLNDPEFKAFYSGNSTKPPTKYLHEIRRSLGALWEYLPQQVKDQLTYGESAPNTRIFSSVNEVQPLREPALALP